MYKLRDIKRLVTMLKMTQNELKLHILSQVSKYYNMESIDFSDGFLYCKGNIPVMLVAHLDTVGATPPQNIVYNKNFITAIESVLGGDDRCGVFTILNILKAGFRPHVLFTEDEEIGGVGATKFVAKYPNKIDLKYILELDRRGSKDCVLYDTGNMDFLQYVESFGFEENWGTFSDISVISPKYDIASVNLSIGYYNEHTKNEYINNIAMFNTFTKVCNMLKDIDNCTYFDMQEIVYSYYNSTPSQSRNLILYEGKLVTYEEYYQRLYSKNLEVYDVEYDEEDVEQIEQNNKNVGKVIDDLPF